MRWMKWKIYIFDSTYQNLFDDGTFRYYWVISSSRVVELTNGVNSQKVSCW